MDDANVRPSTVARKLSARCMYFGWVVVGSGESRDIIGPEFGAHDRVLI